jgi:serine/threonine-protein kinase SRPK3
MNGSDIKKAAIEKAKAKVSQAQQAVNGNSGTKKKRKGEQLKPIITTDPTSPAASTPLHHTAPHMKGAYANQLSRSPSTSASEDDGQSVQDEEDTEGKYIKF